MEAQQRYAQVSQWVVLAVLFATLFIGGIGGYAIRASDGTQAEDASHTVLIPRSAREDDGNTVQVNSLIPRTMREGPERTDGTR